jgi:hypothetical protein
MISQAISFVLAERGLDSVTGFCKVDIDVIVLDKIFFWPISNIVTLVFSKSEENPRNNKYRLNTSAPKTSTGQLDNKNKSN